MKTFIVSLKVDNESIETDPIDMLLILLIIGRVTYLQNKCFLPCSNLNARLNYPLTR